MGSVAATGLHLPDHRDELGGPEGLGEGGVDADSSAFCLGKGHLVEEWYWIQLKISDLSLMLEIST